MIFFKEKSVMKNVEGSGTGSNLCFIIKVILISYML